MSRRSKRTKRQAKRAAATNLVRQLQESAPSAISPQLVAEITQYQGPIPPPNLLSQYNEIVTDGAERIIAMAEEQQHHRIFLERTVVVGDSRRSWCGLILGFVAVLVVAGTGLTIAILRHPAAGSWLIGTTIASLAGVFVYSQHSRRSERSQKAKLATGRR